MKIQVLGASGSVGRGRNTAAFLIDEFLLLDAGTVSRMLTRRAQAKISHILLSHAHLDHIKSIPFLIDNINLKNKHKKFITLYSGREVLSDIKKHIFNNRIWPDFSAIPSPEEGLLRYHPLSTRITSIEGYRIQAVKVNHTVPAYGYLVEDPAGNCLMYSGDSGPTEKIWQTMRRKIVKALIVEVSFPNALRKLALLTGHLTPALLKQEIKKMPVLPGKLLIAHTKKGYRKAIERELQTLKNIPWEILYDDMEIAIS